MDAVDTLMWDLQDGLFEQIVDSPEVSSMPFEDLMKRIDKWFGGPAVDAFRDWYTVDS